MRKLSDNPLIQFIFFGNYFYGLCVVGLSVEASLQQQFPLNPFLYYLFVFALTVVYYTRAYLSVQVDNTSNKRLLWYGRNKKLVRFTQGVFAIFVVIYLVYFSAENITTILALSWLHWFFLMVFPVASILYYGLHNQEAGHFNLRNIGWLKPFVIGFTWAGLVTIYPVLSYCVENELQYKLTLVGSLLFLKNFMFVTVLCILFDIKDYASDSRQNLQTFIVKAGLRKTIFNIVLPLCIVGLGSFIFYGLRHQFSSMKLLLNFIPFFLLILVAYSLQKRRPVLYYLVIVDGLMLVKAICGSLAMYYF
jgi:4-hydroxybenzoate polyprenyltransferase